MNISSLIELAKDAAGSYGELAERIGRPASRISDWKAGRRKPDAADIMLLAEVAGRPVFETLAEIEMELDTERSSVWQRALGNLRAAGVAATVVLGATAVASLTSKPADAAEKAQENKDLARPAGIEPATPAFGVFSTRPLPFKINALRDSQSANPRLIKVNPGHPSTPEL
ncbi:helix-turn-helix family protein [Burkholderia pseudomallei MSHR4375]|uniref:helix-turn-helix domain-containing protein n=1 Tax=Burkholderia pseudomallei TaxID=28450 RepID=UPI00053788C2|nr:helix-turn-helix transcriptional regulator [Burkholderia pseudomallei]KGV82658.1 helix-turn-helix family protein [Burkholderia pseudomallei MSHR4375]